MLLILLLWLYIVAICVCLGVSLEGLLQRIGGWESTGTSLVLQVLLGMMTVTFMGMSLSLVMPLNGMSHFIILICALVAGVFSRKRLMFVWGAFQKKVRDLRWFVWLPAVFLILIFAYISYMPSSHFDDGLYYSTSIKWMEEYGVVKGIANINPRVALNSSWHTLQAVFGMRFLQLGLFNELNSLIMVLMFVYAIGGVNGLANGSSRFHDVLRSVFLLPLLGFHFTANSDLLLYNVNFLSSSSPDFPVAMLVIFCGMLFLEGAAKEKAPVIQDVALLLLSVWMFTIKLSSIPVFLLCLYCLFRIFKSGRKMIGLGVVVCVFCILFLLPWLTRNVLISGYLIFPVSAIDLFNVPWKLPVVHVDWFANSVITSALGADIHKEFTLSIIDWWQGWFGPLFYIKKLLLVLCAVSLIVLPVAGFMSGIKKVPLRWAIFYGYALVSLLFWVTKAPDFRFGYGFIISFLSFSVALFLKYFMEEQVRYVFILFIASTVLLLIFHYKNALKAIPGTLLKAPLPYRMPEKSETVKLKHDVFITIVFDNSSWNAPLPAANDHEYSLIRPVMMGETIKDGFKPGPKQ